MQNLPWHPHYDVWALIVTLVVFFEFTTNKEHLKKPKRKTWYSGLLALWIFTDYPLHDIGEKYLFSVHSVEHLVLALVSPPLLLMGMHREMKELISVKPFIKILRITSKPVVAFFYVQLCNGRDALVICCKPNGNKHSCSFFYTLDNAFGLIKYVGTSSRIQ